MKKTKTFAQRAKAIINKYKRADWDSIEKSALESSLQKLQEEQELFKTINGIGENQVQNESVNSQQFSGFETSYINIPNQDTSSYSTPDDYEAYAANQNEIQPYSTSTTPQLISGATSVLGNLGLALGANKRSKNDIYTPIQNNKVNPEQISLARSREAIRREAAKSSNRIGYEAAQGSKNSNDLMANKIAGEAMLTSKVGELLENTYEKEALTNSAARSRASEINANSSDRMKMFNKQMESQKNREKMQNISDRDAYLSAAIGTIPQTMKDINMSKKDDMYMNIIGEDYHWGQIKDPNTGKMKKVRIFTNKETGKQYVR